MPIAAVLQLKARPIFWRTIQNFVASLLSPLYTARASSQGNSFNCFLEN